MYDGITALNHAFARTLYVIEFFVAWMAIFTVWGQVGGQSHLDLMPWHVKLSLSLAAAAAAVKATAAAASAGRAWNRKTILWLLIIALLGVLMGLVTYYYHVTEPQDEEESQQVALLIGGLVQS
jgi:4-amino-4-deoxy-L-arabinose transferase-like glycosyltransferase